MPRKKFLPWLMLVSLKILVNTSLLEASPNFNIDIDDQFFEEEISELEVIQNEEISNIEDSLISDELELRYRDKIEEKVLEIANDITSNKRILGSTLGSEASVDQERDLLVG